MKVVLPDSSELELPEGATGLDAARAIGPKLAEQAVLVRSNGKVQDLRAPLVDGEPIQIVTTRDADDPDALAVLRHSAAHLLAEAVRRLYPGVKVAIGPPIESGFYYDFEFPEPIREEDLERIEAEIFGCLDFAAFHYEHFGMEARFELSTRPDDKLGTDEEWDFTEAALRSALERREIEYYLGEGEGAFYGPKIDLHMLDVLGRSWQMGTIQLDAQMPKQFGLTFMGADNVEHTPYVVHRALLGSLERFMGILIEHYAGAFPAWLAPVQVRVLPVAEPHREAVGELLGALRLAGVRADADERDETLGKRIRDAELQKIPYVVVWGDRETREAMAVRKRGGEGVTTLSLEQLVDEIAEQSPSE